MSKKKYIVVPRTTNAMRDGLKTSKGKFEFGKKTAKIVDESLVGEIDAQYGLKGSNDVWVHEDENYAWHEHHDKGTDGKMTGIHKYTFSGVDMTGIKTTKDNGYVWAWKYGKQVLMKREVAVAEGYKIVQKGKK